MQRRSLVTAVSASIIVGAASMLMLAQQKPSPPAGFTALFNKPNPRHLSSNIASAPESLLLLAGNTLGVLKTLDLPGLGSMMTGLTSIPDTELNDTRAGLI